MPSIEIDCRNTFSDFKNSNVALFFLSTHDDYQKSRYARIGFHKYTYKNFVNYCNEHGYDFYSFNDRNSFSEFEFLDDSLNYSHCLFKFEAILKLLKKGYEYIFFMDGLDTLITNPSINLESFVNKEKSIFLSIGPFVLDWEKAKRPDNIDGGFLGIRNTKKSKVIIKSAIDYVYDLNKSINLNQKDVYDDVIWEKLVENINFKNSIAIGDPLQQKFWLTDRAFDYTREELINQQKRLDIWEEGDFMVHLGVFCDRDCSKHNLVEEFISHYLKND